MSEATDTAVTVQRLLGVIHAVKAHALRVWLATLVLGTLGAIVATFTAALLLDHYLLLPGAIRLLLLIAVIGVPIFVFRQTLARRPSGSTEDIALLIERRYPQLDNALINTLQLANQAPTGSEGIVAAVTQDAGFAIGSIQPTQAVPTRTLSVAAAIAGVSLLAFILFAILNSRGLGAGLARVLLPLGDTSLTRIAEVQPGNTDMLLNSPIQITARVTGRIPTQAELLIIHPDGRRASVPMLAPSATKPDRFNANIDRVEENLQYQVIAGDGRSSRFTLNARRKPTIQKITQTITPPDYIHAKPTQQTGGNVTALVGSKIDLALETAEPVRDVRIIPADGPAPLVKVEPLIQGDTNASAITTTLQVTKSSSYRVELVSEFGFDSDPISYDISLLEDRVPQAELSLMQSDGSRAAVASEIEVDLDARLTLSVAATDDHALRELRLERLPDGSADDASAQPLAVNTWSIDNKTTPRLTQTTTINVAEMGLTTKSPIMLRAAANDHRPDAPAGASAVFTIRLKSPPSEQELAPPQLSRVSLAGLLAKQRANIVASEILLAQSEPNYKPESSKRPEDLPTIAARQDEIRDEATQIAGGLSASSANPVIQKKLENLSQTLMVVAIEQLRAVPPDAAGRIKSLPAAIDTQKAILTALAVAEARQDQDLAERRQREISEALAQLLAREQTLRKDTQAAKESGKSLAARQSVLAREAVRVHKLVQLQASTGAGGNAELATQYEAIANGFESRAIRKNMLVAAENLAKEDAAAAKEALTLQDRVVADLAELIKLLRGPALAAAKEELQDAQSQLAKAKEKIDKLEKLQQSITEMSKELKKNKDLTEGKSIDGDLEDLVESRKNVQDVIEQMIKDMHVLPDAVASNDLLEELSEVYEQVKQKEGSADSPVSEVAVDRDEALLQSLKAMQKGMGERIGDLEMWLMDKPDSTRFKNESFDKQELGQIPLGDLPDSLDDIVGDLVEQSEKLEKEAQDSASNQALPDGLMGWDIGDGPMPSWAAKGKSGNSKPNAMEQTGRSGSGRQGESSGEIVGDTVKSLEGGDVKARRTNEGFQAGELKEEDDSKMDVKATGGGKLAGTSSSEGFAGDSPARDELKYRDMARQAQQIKRDAETVYSKAKLLRLPTGDLDRAVMELDAATRRLSQGDTEGFAKAQQQVVRALKQTQSQLVGGTVNSAPSAAGNRADPNLAGAAGEPVPKQYEDAVADYMRTIAQEPR